MKPCIPILGICLSLAGCSSSSPPKVAATRYGEPVSVSPERIASDRAALELTRAYKAKLGKPVDARVSPSAGLNSLQAMAFRSRRPGYQMGDVYVPGLARAVPTPATGSR
jgi:hypothetical protein